MRLFVGGLMAGVILYFVPGVRSGPACLIAGVLLCFLLLQAGPRSIVEKVVLALTVAAIAWVAGPQAARSQSVCLHFLGWTAAGAALAFYQLPKAD